MRKNPAANGPSWFEVIFGAVLSVALGAVLGLVLLAFAPVTVVKALPSDEERDPRAVYFVEGSRDGNKARNASTKRKSFLEGQTVTLTEDELNVLAGPPTPFAKPKPVAAKAGVAAAPKAPAPAKSGDKTGEEMLTMGTANFRLLTDKIQIAVPVTVSVLGLEQKIVVQSEGAFVKNGDMFAYEPATIFIGACPVHRVPYLATYAREKVLAQKIPEPLAASWAKLASVAIEDKTLRLRMP
jgi:hypothetical protein